MKLEEVKEAYSLDDILIRPQHSELDSRKEVDISTKITAWEFKIPIVSSPMKSVTEYKMAIEMKQLGGLGIIHRFLSEEKQIEEIIEIVASSKYRPIAVAINSDKKRIEKLVRVGADILCIDVAHGDTKKSMDMIKYLRKEYPQCRIMSGNVATRSAAERVINAGAEILRVGLGGGSVCTTRIQTGVGVPNATALDEIYGLIKEKEYKNSIVLDGGIKNSGDIVKALALGADAVIVGRLLAGCDESSAEIKEVGGKKFKIYRGMASLTEQIAYKGKQSDDLYNEGEETLIEMIGPLKNTINSMIPQIKSGFAYVGARNIAELRHNASFIKITGAGMYESMPHALKKK